MSQKTLSDRVYNLRFIQRYTLSPRITSETVAEHSFFVCVILLELYEKYEFNLDKALRMALVHDFAECELGDITLTAKQLHPELFDVVKKAETKIMHSFNDIVSEAYNEYINRESRESLMVKYADILQVKQYLEFEKHMGGIDSTKKMILETEFYISEYIKKIESFLRYPGADLS